MLFRIRIALDANPVSAKRISFVSVLWCCCLHGLVQLFVIQTTGKTLYFLAKDAAERKKWVSTVEAVLSVLKST